MSIDPVVAHPHAKPQPYALILRTWTYQWWRPLLGIILLPLAVIVLAPIVLVPMLMVALFIQDGTVSQASVSAAINVKHVTPASMLYLNLTLASATLVTWAIIRFVHRMRPRWLASVKPFIRWRFLLVCFGLAFVALVAQVVVGAFLPGDPNDLDASPNKITGRVIALAIVVLISTPLQAIGEEYAFRGYLMQAFGALTKRPYVAILITSVLFALAHGVQNTPLFADRFLFGLMAGYVVHRIGGLEAGIAMHVWNNLLAFGFAIFLGNVDHALTVSEVSWWNLPLTLTQNGVFLVLVLVVAPRMGITNRTSPPVLVEPAGAM